MSKCLIRVLSCIMVVVLSFSMTTSAFASTKSFDNSKSQYLQSVQTATPYITKNPDGTLALRENVKSLGIDSMIYNSMVKNLQFVNSMITKGYLTADEKGNLTITKKYIGEIKRSSNYFQVNKNEITVSLSNIKTASSTGETKIVWQWYGFDLYLDSATANRLSSGANIGAALGALIPDVALRTVVSVVLAASAGAIGAANAEGRGVIIKCTVAFISPMVPTVEPFWISSQ